MVLQETGPLECGPCFDCKVDGLNVQGEQAEQFEVDQIDEYVHVLCRQTLAALSDRQTTV
jgi:hypothetical protein